MCCLDNQKVNLDNNQFVRSNGWALPLNGLQIFAWILEIFTALVFFGAESIALEKSMWVPSIVCIGVVYVINVVLLAAATSINPADDSSLLRFKTGNKKIPAFDRSVHAHVIENSYCHICEVAVGIQSKHCSACNKCVSVFDHHCKWLNNCVGQKNYRIFLATQVFVLLSSVGMLVVSLFVFINAVQGFQNLNPGVWWRVNGSAAQIVIEVLIMVKVVVLLGSIILVLQLFSFHVMLVYQGITTYEYIKRSINKETAPQKSSSATVVPSNNPSNDRRPNNGNATNHTSEESRIAFDGAADRQVPPRRDSSEIADLAGQSARLQSTTTSPTVTHENLAYVRDTDESMTSIDIKINGNNLHEQSQGHMMPNAISDDSDMRNSVV